VSFPPKLVRRVLCPSVDVGIIVVDKMVVVSLS
jgi:hypothetical protein